MAHNIETADGQHNIAFRGSRKDVWHSLGQEMEPGMSVEQWAVAAGLNWHAVKAPALVDLRQLGGNFAVEGNNLRTVNENRFIVRSDNGHVLGCATNRYQPVQPAELLAWFEQYISVDNEHFQLDVAGALKQGEIIWATATYNGDMTIGGDKHVARLLMSTTFDGTGATINQGTMTRVVCNNTLNAALADKRAVVRTRHNTKFNAVRVGEELATVAKGFGAYKAMGDKMASIHTTQKQVSDFFKSVLDIPFDAKKDDVSTRKMNMFDELNSAYRTTANETESGTAWCMLQSITRFIDHDRSTRGGNGSPEENRFLSAQFGSGANLKAKAVQNLYEVFGIEQKDLVKV